MPRDLKLTTIDLPIPRELLVRSLLALVNEKTVDRWSFGDDTDVHVAISGGSSVLRSIPDSASTIRPSRQITLIDSGMKAAPDRQCLTYPIRPSEFADLLNSISDSLVSFRPGRENTGSLNVGPTASLPADSGEYRLAFALRELLRLASRNAYRVTANGVQLDVLPATRSLLARKPLDEESIARLLHSRTEVTLSPIVEKEVEEQIAAGAKFSPIDGLLWRIGLETCPDHTLPGLPKDGYFALKRWPDFGRLSQDRSQLRMASVLTLAAHNIHELARASDSTPQQARAFINACALFDLIEIRSQVSNDPPLARQSGSQRTQPGKRFGSVFQSIRFALGLGNS